MLRVTWGAVEESVWWRRLKATLERVQRLAHSYTDQLLAVYPDRVQALGQGLGMDQERLKVSAAAETVS